MTARLQLIDMPALEHRHHAPRVFTAAFQTQLAQLNQAERALRGLDLRVLWRRLGDQGPQVRIERQKDQSLAPLLDQMGPRSFVKVLGGTLVSGAFQGVAVSWMEPA